jgi:hypothetical protein
MGAAGSKTSFSEKDAEKKFPKKTDVYTKTEADTAFPKKTDVYTKTEADNKFQVKSSAATSSLDAAAYYTKSESDSKFATKTELQSVSAPDANRVSETLATNNVFLTALSNRMAASAVELGKNVAANLTPTTKVEINEAIMRNATFRDELARTLTANSTYANAIRGPAGSIASPETVENTLKPKTLWCADGSSCATPSVTNVVSLNSPNTVLNNDFTANRWILHAPRTGEQSLYIAPTEDNNTDWQFHKQGIRITRQGVILAPKGKVHMPEGKNLCNSNASKCIDVAHIVTSENNSDGNPNTNSIKVGNWTIRDEGNNGEFLTFESSAGGAKTYIHKTPAGKTSGSVWLHTTVRS